jgi:hypothetical protein
MFFPVIFNVDILGWWWKIQWGFSYDRVLINSRILLFL